MTINEILKTNVALWKPWGCLGCTVVVSDLGSAGCQRPCLVLTYSGRGDENTFLGEYDSRRTAQKIADRLNKRLGKLWEKN